MNKTISAISTASGAGGVAIIRMSGENALSIAEKMFIPMGKTPVASFEPYKMYPGNIQAEHFTDFGMAVYFKGPKSYTGEDTVEFHCHGGTEIAKGILKMTFRLGAEPAEAGEFTKRAFLNGKMSLSSAEGVADMINANSESMIKAGFSLLNNELGQKVSSMQARIKNLLASIEVDIDYPEEDLEHSLPDLTGIQGILKELIAQTETLKRGYVSAGRTVKGGVTVAIVGKPNSGKSSLLNAILGYGKAIVSDIEGTTRDVVEGEIDLHGIRFRLYDTAGIRESGDTIEQIGVEKAEETISSSDIVLHVIDISAGVTAEDEKIKEEISKTDKFLRLTVYNKSDKLSGELSLTENEILISAKEKQNIDPLLDRLYDSVKDRYTFNSDFVIEERHYRALERASESLKNALLGTELYSMEVVTIDLSQAFESLGEITGETANEEIIQEIFSKFCVGK